MSKLDRYTEGFRAKYERFTIGCEAIEEEGLWNCDEFGEMDVYYLNEFVTIILRLIVADGRIGNQEVDYLNLNFNFNYGVPELERIYQNCKDDINSDFGVHVANEIERLDVINAKLSCVYRELIELICDIIANSDDIISSGELEEMRIIRGCLEYK